MSAVASPEAGAAVSRWLWLSLGVVVLDQFTKLVAEGALDPYRPVSLLPFFNLTLVYNTGAAFSLLADAGGWQRWFFLGLSAVVSLALVVWIVRLPRGQGRLALALALVLGGAVGNLIDRALYGHVIDFLDLHYGGWHWPAFNVADAAITVGAVLLVADTLLGKRHES